MPGGKCWPLFVNIGMLGSHIFISLQLILMKVYIFTKIGMINHVVTEVYFLFERKQGLKKNLDSSLPLGQVSLKFCLLWTGPSLTFKDLVGNDLTDPLPIGQMRMKNSFLRRKIYLSWIMGHTFVSPEKSE